MPLPENLDLDEKSDELGEMNHGKIMDQFVDRRAGRSASLQIAWREALSLLPVLPGPLFGDIAQTLPNPWTTRQLARMLDRDKDPEAALGEFIEEVNESRFSMVEWFKAFEVMARYLENSSQRPSFKEITGYLACCAEALDARPSLETFPMAVETMLQNHGFEGSGRQAGDPPS